MTVTIRGSFQTHKEGLAAAMLIAARNYVAAKGLGYFDASKLSEYPRRLEDHAGEILALGTNAFDDEEESEERSRTRSMNTAVEVVRQHGRRLALIIFVLAALPAYSILDCDADGMISLAEIECVFDGSHSHGASVVAATDSARTKSAAMLGENQ